MDAPQSRLEIDPVEAALKQLDPRIYIAWNPDSEALLYDDIGSRLHAGRWEVRGLIEGKDELIWTWGSELGPDRPYRPVTMQLVEFMQTWDAANRNVREEFVRRREIAELAEAKQAAEVEEGRKEQIARFATDELGAKEIIGTGTDFGEGPESPAQVQESMQCQPS